MFWLIILPSSDINTHTNLDFALMNCLSEYPPKYSDMNLNLIEKMIEEFPTTWRQDLDHEFQKVEQEEVNI